MHNGNSVDHDKLASEASDLDLLCFQKRIYRSTLVFDLFLLVSDLSLENFHYSYFFALKCQIHNWFEIKRDNSIYPTVSVDLSGP